MTVAALLLLIRAIAAGLRLRERVGRGYSIRNLRYFRSFYQAYADREPLIRDARGEFGTGLVPNLGEVGTLVAVAGRQVPATENDRHVPKVSRRNV